MVGAVGHARVRGGGGGGFMVKSIYLSFFTQREELGEEYLAFFMVLSVYFFPSFA